MANCIRCGRELPVYVPEGNVCPDCARSMMQERAAQQQAAPSMTLAQSRAMFPVTTWLVGANVAVFIAMVVSGVSFIDPSTRDLLRWGADSGPFTLDRQWWRLVTSMFVHGGILHIGFNMWAFWNLGRLAERIFGRWTYFLVYMATGIASSLTSLLWHPVEVSVGASGAIFGVAGALISALKLGRLPIPGRNLKAIIRSLVAFAAYNLFFGAAVPFIDNAAHLGGFGFGLLAGGLLSRSLTAEPERREGQQRAIFLLLLVLLAGSAAFVQRACGWVATAEIREKLLQPEPPR